MFGAVVVAIFSLNVKAILPGGSAVIVNPDVGVVELIAQ
jgi:hypothetical protein